MKMSDIRPGMRLRSTFMPRETVTVTALTERGFLYDLDAPRRIMPMMTQCQHGHEHYGLNGESFYELADDPPTPDILPMWEEVLVSG